MLSQQENELLTRVGPGTPMGQLLRLYWTPALLSSEVVADGPPVRIRLLGENLIAFRDTQGRIGLLADHCSHRGASLFFGRNEEGGLRCVYHGWKYDVNGRCVDMPNEPPETSFKDKIQHCAYPCQERGGIVWTYMGQARPAAVGDNNMADRFRKDSVAISGAASGHPPRNLTQEAAVQPGLGTGLPPLPHLEANMLPAGEEQVWCAMRECNWVQGLEGEIDTSHFGFLHRSMGPDYHPKPGTFDYYMEKDRQPRYSVVETEYGAFYGAYRPAEPDTYYWRIAQFLLPFFSMIPPGVLGRQIITRAWVPLDDEHTMFWSLSTKNARPPEVESLEGRPPASINVVEMLPNTSDWLGRWRLVANRTNDYQIDREAQRTTSFTGLPGVHMQDQAITESMGPIWDRSKEHVGAADAMVVTVRQVLLQAATALRDRGEVPVTVDRPDLYEVRSGGAVLPRDVDWLEATKEARKAFPKEPVALPG